MVPHESVEQSIVTILLGGEQSERVFAIVGVSDSAKGEALVLSAVSMWICRGCVLRWRRLVFQISGFRGRFDE